MSKKDKGAVVDSGEFQRSEVSKEVRLTAYGEKGITVQANSDLALCQLEEYIYPNGEVKSFYSVKKSTTDGGLYNPRALFGNKNKTKQNGIDIYKFISVKKDVFENYLSYLETGNNTFFNRAERVALHES